MSTGRAHLETWLRRVWFEEDQNAIDELYVVGGEAHGLGEQPLMGPDDFKVFHKALCDRLHNINCQIDKSIEEGPWLSAICTLKANCSQSGKPVVITGNIFARIEEEKIQEAYNHFDFMGLWGQLGFLPEDSFAKGLAGEKIV